MWKRNGQSCNITGLLCSEVEANMAHIPSLTCGGDACGLEARLVVTSMVKKVQLTQNTSDADHSEQHWTVWEKKLNKKNVPEN